MAAKIPCIYCKKIINGAASRCPYCQGEYTPEQVAERSKTANKTLAIGCASLLGLVVLIGMCSDGGGESSGDIAATSGAANMPTTPTAPKALSDAESKLTAPQKNARRKAEQYLGMSGFSRKGLIEQLSSDSGEGFELADATAAVDSMTVDWNEQAVRKAQSYLEMSGFSCKGLIEQLSSSSGEGFTKSQAKHGAEKAGAC